MIQTKLITIPAANGEVTVTIGVLSVREEQALLLDLRRKLRESYGPGGFFANAKPYLEWLKSQKLSAEYSLAVSRITEMEASAELPTEQAAETFRQTPTGVAIELWHRARKYDVCVTLQDLRSIITEVNALEVHLQLIEAITGLGKDTSP
jgi:hypothetical protein